MTSLPILQPGVRVTDANGNPVSGAKLKFFAAGTTTPLTVYSDADGSTQLGSTVYTDDAGYPVTASGGSTKTLIYATAETLKVVITDPDDTVIATHDNVTGSIPDPATDTTATPVSPVVVKSSDYVIVSSDRGKVINVNCVSGNVTMSLPSVITVGDGWLIGIRHAGNSTTNVVNIVPTGTQTISRPGHATAKSVTLYGLGEAVWLVSDGAGWNVTNYAPQMISGSLPRFAVEDRLPSPPASPVAGSRYIVTGTPTGDWASLGFSEHDVLEYNGANAWFRYTPRDGWTAYIKDENFETQFRDTAWVDLSNAEAPTTAEGIIEAVHREAQNVGGGSVSAGAYTPVKFNVARREDITDGSFDVGQYRVTLPAGTYRHRIDRPVSNTTTNDAAVGRLRLYNVTASTYVFGNNTQIGNSSNWPTSGILTLDAVVEITEETVFEVQIYADSPISYGNQLNITDEYEYYGSWVIEDVNRQGPRGAQGQTGPNLGYEFTWDNGTTDTDPGTGELSVNAASWGSATYLYISKTGANGESFGNIIATWDNSTNPGDKGRIRLRSVSTPAVYLDAIVAGALVDATTYWKVPIATVTASATEPVAGTAIAITFAATGNQGDVGAVTTHPLGLGDRQVIMHELDTHFWSGPIMYDETRNRFYIVYTRTIGHAIEYTSNTGLVGGQLCIKFSEDGCHSWSQERVIWSVAGSEPRFPVGRIMGSGRIGIFFANMYRSGGALTQDMRFIYSDDAGSTWTQTTVSVGAPLYGYGEMLQYPAAAGGHDTTGFIFYGYGGSPIDILYCKTTDNGATWTTGVAVHNASGINLAEASVFKLNATTWGMLIRDDRSTSSTAYNARASISTNMTTWSTDVDSGITLGANPITGIVSDSTLYVYACMREGYGDPLSLNNRLVWLSVPVNTFITSSGALGSQTWSKDGFLLNRFTGYLFNTTDADGKSWAVASAGEDIFTAGDDVAGQDLVLFSPYKMLGNIDRSAQKNYLVNADFQAWNFGTAFTTAGPAAICDSWNYDGSGATASIQRATVDSLISPFLPHQPYYCLSIDNSADPDDFANIYQDITDIRVISELSYRAMTVSGWASGDVPSDFTVQVLFNFGTGGSSSLNTTATLEVQPYSGGLWYFSANIVTPSIYGATIGTSPFVRFGLKGLGAVDNFTCRLYGVKWELGRNSTTFERDTSATAGDVVGPSSAGDGVVALFSGTTGKAIKVATQTGLAKLASGTLSAAVAGTDYVVPGGALGTPSSGTMTNVTGLPISTGVSGLGTGVATFLATPSSANLAAALSDETGTGANVFANTPTLIAPILGTPTSGTLTNCTGLPVSTGVSGLGTGVATFLATPSSANLRTALTDETGTGAAVFATSPTLVTPDLGTPSAATLTNATGLPISTGVSGLGTGVATFLATPSSANLRSALTDETGTGAAVFATSPTISAPAIANPVITGTTQLNDSAAVIYFYNTAGTVRTGYFQAHSTSGFFFNMELNQPMFFYTNNTLRLTLDAGGANAAFTVPVKTPSTTVASLPSASTAGAGARMFVTDANATTFNSVVASGGANAVPVFSDGTNWKIG